MTMRPDPTFHASHVVTFSSMRSPSLRVLFGHLFQPSDRAPFSPVSNNLSESLEPLRIKHTFLRHLGPLRKAKWVVYAKAPFDEAVPIGVIARKPRHLKTERKTNVGECNLGGEARKSGTRDGARAGKAEILIDDENAILGPAELACLAGKRILALRQFAIVLDLRGARLTKIRCRVDGGSIPTARRRELTLPRPKNVALVLQFPARAKPRLSLAATSGRSHREHYAANARIIAATELVGGRRGCQGRIRPAAIASPTSANSTPIPPTFPQNAGGHPERKPQECILLNIAHFPHQRTGLETPQAPLCRFLSQVPLP